MKKEDINIKNGWLLYPVFIPNVEENVEAVCYNYITGEYDIIPAFFEDGTINKSISKYNWSDSPGFGWYNFKLEEIDNVVAWRFCDREFAYKE